MRVIEYDVPDREGDGKDELIVLVTTITGFRAATAQALAGACHQRWEHETGNAQLKTCLRGPGRVLRPGSPDLIEQEIWGYLLTRYAPRRPDLRRRHQRRDRPGPGQVQAHPARHPPGRRPGFPPEQARTALARVIADITRNKNLNPGRRHRTCPRAIKRGRHNAYRVNRPRDKNIQHDGPAAIRLANPVKPQAAA